MRVEAVGRTARPADDVFERIRGADELHAALAEADFVVDAMPLTPQTRHLFDAAAFAAMKPTARFINVGRGATVDERALVEALSAGRLAGAALDVFEQEPLPPDSPLWDMEQVIVFPHMSGDVEGWEADFANVFYDNVGRWLRGEPLHNVVDKRLGFPTDP
jgi:phosphoglycerate dehydrogenase-like enzyme